jgi:hypothetical protein
MDKDIFRKTNIFSFIEQIEDSIISDISIKFGKYTFSKVSPIIRKQIGLYEKCMSDDCNELIFICNKCFNQNESFGPREKESTFCESCNNYRKNLKTVLKVELDQFDTNGYNTFGNLDNIIISYLI